MLTGAQDGKTILDVASNPDVITMGINSSHAHLHTGHYLTMYQALLALHRNPQAKGKFFVDDREFDMKKIVDDDTQRYRVPTAESSHMIGASMRVFADRVSWELKDDSIVERLHVQRMSEFMKAPEGSSTVSREMYGLLRRHNGRLRTLFAMLPREGMTRYFRPFCEDCERGPRFDRQFISSPDSLSTHCPEHGTYSVEPAKQTNWTMYYQIDPLRDVLLSDNRQRRVLHVFGGDYGVREGMHSSKADKLSVMTQFLSPDTIDHFVGPLLTKEGQKMSKSTGHRTNIPDINVLDELARSGKGSIPMDNAA